MLFELNIGQGYGMIEFCFVFIYLFFEDYCKGGVCLCFVGLFVKGVELCIQDEDGIYLFVGEIGEVCVKVGNFM